MSDPVVTEIVHTTYYTDGTIVETTIPVPSWWWRYTGDEKSKYIEQFMDELLDRDDDDVDEEEWEEGFGDD